MRGERFAGRYELVDAIGGGGMGAVWRAWDHREAAYVAAKVLRHTDADALLRFVREQALRVAHPHVVAPSGWAADDDRVLLTMDLVRGGSVQDLLSDYGPLPLPHVVVLLGQLLDGLGAVHAHGIVHRDVKPPNLLLEPTGRGRPLLRLADFGIAVVRGEPRLTSRGSFLGTPGYIAPEVIGGAEPDPRQDLFPVGVLAMEMITGHRPTGWPSVIPGPRPAHVPASLWDLACAMLAPTAGERPSSAAEAAASLAATPVDATAFDPGDPDAVEVFEHVGALPPGYTPTGPVGTRAAAATPPHHGSRSGQSLPAVPARGPAGRDASAQPPAPPPVPPPDGDRGGSPAASTPGPARTGPDTPAREPGRAAHPTGDTVSRRPGRVAAAGARPGAPSASAAPAGPARRRPGRRAGMVAGVVTALAGLGLIIAALNGTFDGGTQDGPSGAPSPRASPPTAAVRVGAACGDVEGVTARATDGSLVVCLRSADGRLRWARS